MRQQTQTIDDLKSRLQDISDQLKQSKLTDDVERQITADLMHCIQNCRALSTSYNLDESIPLVQQQKNKEIDDLIQAAQQNIIDRHVLGSKDCMSSKPYVVAISISTALALLWLCFSIYLDITGDRKKLSTNLFITGVALMFTTLQAAFAFESFRNMRRISREREEIGSQLFPNNDQTSYFEQFRSQAVDASLNQEEPHPISRPRQ